MTLFSTVQELLFNVAKHAGVKEAHVSIRPDEGRHLFVVVSDCGAGFDPSALRARGGSSGGFGLFTIQERLQALGGSIAIESRPGSGSAFTIRVPAEVPGPSGQVSGRPAARRGTAVGAASGRPGGSCPEGRRIRVLLVDDHLVVRQGLAMVLGGEPDIEIVGEASNGETAVSLAAGLLPDVVTMDINLPGMSGIEATRVIHAEHPEISIIGLSMFEEEGDAMRNAGAVGYLSKTGPSAKLLEVIRSACRKKPT
jgi:CheY-like chemotaxis protein